MASKPWLPKLLLVGPGRCGKDTAGEWLSTRTKLRFAGTTSKFLAKYVASASGVDADLCYATRHQNRDLWHKVGRRIRGNDPAVLIREALREGEITGGCRDLEELEAARDEGLVDLIVWISNVRCESDFTLHFNESHCDIIIENHWGLHEFWERLDRFARAMGLRIVE